MAAARRRKSSRLIRTLVTIATWPLAALLGLLAGSNLYQVLGADVGETGPALLIVLILLSWVGFGILVGFSRRLMPFMIVMSIPVATALALNISISVGQLALIAIGIFFFILVVKQLYMTLQIVACCVAVALSFALSVIPPFVPLFTGRSAAVSWAIALIVTWLAASVGVNLIDSMLRPAKHQRRNRLAQAVDRSAATAREVQAGVAEIKEAQSAGVEAP